MSTLTILHHLKENPLCVCDDCGKYSWFNSLQSIRDPQDRLTAGDEVPAGECAECGSLAYIADDNNAPCRIKLVTFKKNLRELLS